MRVEMDYKNLLKDLSNIKTQYDWERISTDLQLFVRGLSTRGINVENFLLDLFQKQGVNLFKVRSFFCEWKSFQNKFLFLEEDPSFFRGDRSEAIQICTPYISFFETSFPNVEVLYCNYILDKRFLRLPRLKHLVEHSPHGRVSEYFIKCPQLETFSFFRGDRWITLDKSESHLDLQQKFLTRAYYYPCSVLQLGKRLLYVKDLPAINPFYKKSFEK